MNFDPAGPSSRRALCATCALPIATCICELVKRVDNRVEVLLLQHPLEVREAKGTARLLALCLSRCRVEVGEVFEPGKLAQWLHGEGRRSVLLYPQTGAETVDAVTNEDFRGGGAQLVVLDGTWRKSLRMLKTNPLLQALPRSGLPSSTTSRYAALRKTRSPTQLSTLEACCLALARIDGDAARYEPVHEAFARFVDERRRRALQGNAGCLD